MDRPRPRKARILDAALREFAERGQAGARTAAIADSAGVNKQLLFYYFGSKADLYEAVLRSFLPASASGTTAGRSGCGPVERIRAALTAFIGEIDTHPEVAPLLVRALAEPGVGRAALAAVLGELEDTLASIVTEGQAHGYVRDDADPRTAAAQIVSLMLGYLVRERAELQPGPSLEARTRWVDATCDLMTRALRW